MGQSYKILIQKKQKVGVGVYAEKEVGVVQAKKHQRGVSGQYMTFSGGTPGPVVVSTDPICHLMKETLANLLTSSSLSFFAHPTLMELFDPGP